MSKLEFWRDGETPRHYLDGRPVSVGDTLELSLSGGRWLRVRYRWNGEEDTLPVFSVVLGGAWELRQLRDPNAVEKAPEAVIRLELEDAVLRWPVTS
jgi:hypothetical protein